MNDTNIAWMAGLFEGEGCIYKDPRCNSYRVSLNLTDLDVLQKLQTVAGCGSITSIRSRKSSHKPAWDWKIHKRAEVIRLLSAMLPYFGNRRAYKALNALDDLELCQ
jgi:hypothetical protein